MAQVRTISIEGVDYEAYDDRGRCSAYLRPNLLRWNTWNKLTAADQGIHLVWATQVIDKLEVKPGYLGERTDPKQTTAFPRTGITGQDSNQVPLEVEEACCLLASSLSIDSVTHSRTNFAKSEISFIKRGKNTTGYFQHAETNAVNKPIQDDEALALLEKFFRTQLQGQLFLDFSSRGNSDLIVDQVDTGEGKFGGNYGGTYDNSPRFSY